ncbi:uncharacterized protein VTP21DRAFT_8685 [Calcarisporiella thermophila]|uniref:uncharacterized protein n=1 Tax=Calcarisporiella thermophila TaxID=911321 RepID=UPI00374484A9
MDQLVFSLCFSRPSSLGELAHRARASFHHPLPLDESLTSQFRALCDHVQQQYGIQAALCTADKFSVRSRGLDPQPEYNIILSGNHQAVMGARGYLLRSNPIKSKLVVRTSRSELFTLDGELKPTVKPSLDEITRSTGAKFLFYEATKTQRQSIQSLSSSGEQQIDIVVTGSWDAIELARLRTLVLLDELLGLRVDQLEIDCKLHNIICGRKRDKLELIMQETATNIYFSPPIICTSSDELQENIVYMTGEVPGIQRAKDMLLKLAAQKAQSMYSKETTMIPRKIDYLLVHNRENLKKIMYDNGSYVAFPTLGSQGGVLSVYGENRVNVERTIRMVMQLACQLYHAQFWVMSGSTSPPSFPGILGFDPTKSFALSHTQVVSCVSQIAQASGAEVAFKCSCFEVFGTERAVRNAYQQINEMDLIKTYHQETKFQVELANEHLEFISGKKNGKINKIMKTSSAKISFASLNDYNFLIDITSPSLTKAFDGLAMLQEELPAEISFHVPESYHKRIIGVGGKNIQRIMKKYGVYVKFSNAEEFATLGGYFDNNDNVVARTPAKNALNLDNLKHSVMELVGTKDKDNVEQTVTIPRRYHRMLLAEKATYLQEIETKTGTKIHFPFKETGEDHIVISGHENQTIIAAQLLQELIPEEYELRLPRSPALHMCLGHVEFKSRVVDRIRQELDILLEVPPISPPHSARSTPTSTPVITHKNFASPASTTGANSLVDEVSSSPISTSGEKGGEYVFLFRFSRRSADGLPNAIQILTTFLQEQQVPLQTESRPRADSFMGAFPHFNSKLLASVSSSTNETIHPAASASLAGSHSGFSSYRLFDDVNAFEPPWKNVTPSTSIRDSTSSSDLRAIFDTPDDHGDDLPEALRNQPSLGSLHMTDEIEAGMARLSTRNSSASISGLGGIGGSGSPVGLTSMAGENGLPLNTSAGPSGTGAFFSLTDRWMPSNDAPFSYHNAFKTNGALSRLKASSGGQRRFGSISHEPFAGRHDDQAAFRNQRAWSFSAAAGGIPPPNTHHSLTPPPHISSEVGPHPLSISDSLSDIPAGFSSGPTTPGGSERPVGEFSSAIWSTNRRRWPSAPFLPPPVSSSSSSPTSGNPRLPHAK